MPAIEERPQGKDRGKPGQACERASTSPRTRESGKSSPVSEAHRCGRARRSCAAIDGRRCEADLRACERVCATARTHVAENCECGRTTTGHCSPTQRGLLSFLPSGQ